ncbi:MAG TPA: outer membrane lipoprotein-sorting protein [Bacteroidales bacterium]|nr:outer membrane lipoprotein-sorting protein [Bacteroidales bacterium]
MKKLIVLIILIWAALYAAAQLPDPSRIMSDCRDMSIAGSMTATVNLTITERNGSVRDRTISMANKTFPGGMEKRFIRFLAPSDVRGTAMLITDNRDDEDEMWIYLPALKRKRRIVTSDRGKSFMSSEFSNADMSSPPLKDFKYTHAEGSGVSDEWIVKGIPVSEDKADEYGYSKKISYIKKQGMIIEKIEFYNYDNELFKIIEIRKVHPLENGRYIVSGMSAYNLKTGRKSEIVFSKISTGAMVDDDIFTLQNLDR